MRLTFRSFTRGLLGLCACGCSEPAGGALPELQTKPLPQETQEDYALVFDGTAQYATTATSSFPVAKASQSVTAWIRPAAGASDQAIFAFRRATESGTELGLSDGLPTVWNVWGMRVFVQGANPLDLDVWYHIAYVQIASSSEEASYEQHLFVDGELVAEGTLPPASRTPTSSWLGALDTTTSHYAGSLDEVRLYARALTPAEIANEANGISRPAQNALIASWNFNERRGDFFAYDRSGHANHATLGDGVEAVAPAREVSTAPVAP